MPYKVAVEYCDNVPELGVIVIEVIALVRVARPAIKSKLLLDYALCSTATSEEILLLLLLV